MPRVSRAELPAVLIENSSRCDTNAAGQQVLPNEEAWLPALMNSVRNSALVRESRQNRSMCPVIEARYILHFCK